MRAKSSKQRCPALCLIDLSYNVKYHCSCRVGGCSGHLTASGSWHGFPGVDHEERQDVAVLISVVTQRGVLVVRIAYGCLYYKDPGIFHLFLKYHKWKIVYSLLSICLAAIHYRPPNVCKPMHLKYIKKVLLIECWKPGLDARSQFQAFAFLKSDMTSSDPGVWCLRLIYLCRG